MTRGVAGSGRDRKAGRVPVPIVTVFVPRLKIVPPSLFEKVQQGLVSEFNFTDYGERRSHASNIKYLVSGIARCDACGHLLRLSSSTQGYRRIGCTYKRDNTAVCRDSGYSMASLERMVVRGLRDLIKDDLLMEHFGNRAREEVGEGVLKKAETLRRLQGEAKELQAVIDGAMMQTFSKHMRLTERREMLLRDMENKLEEIEKQIAFMTRADERLPADALPTLRAMFDEIDVRAPFLPDTPDEIVVFMLIRRLVHSLRVRRIDRHVFEATAEYDLGPFLGTDLPAARIVRTMRFDGRIEKALTCKQRQRKLDKKLEQGQFDLPGKSTDTLWNFPAFQIFGDCAPETRKKIIKVLLFKAAYNATLATFRDILGEEYEELRPRIDEFRKSACVPAFVAAACVMFPDIPLSSKALRPAYLPVSSIPEELAAQDHPFLKLAMCSPDAGRTSIPDEHWRVVTSLGLGLNKVGLRARKEKVADGWDRAKRTLEAIAIVVRERVRVKEAAMRVGLARTGVTSVYAMLRDNGDLRKIAELLLELEPPRMR